MRRRVPLALAAVTAAGIALSAGVEPHHVFGFLPDGSPHRATTLRVGDVVELPEVIRGRCLHIVALHSSCRGCERLVPGRPRTVWLTNERDDRDVLYPHMLVSPALWELLGVEAFPAEFVVSASGRVLFADVVAPGRPPPSCESFGGEP